ncbi:MAG: hypothetical protein ACSHX6_04610 [Akkermansiaceae bacterium]
MVDLLMVIPFGRDEAKEAAKVRVLLEAFGKGIGPMDALIAVLVLAGDCLLVTRNTK